jgi:cytochrome c peroxidase
LGTAPFDRWAAGEASAISPAAARGFGVFAGKGKCLSCHTGALFTDNKFHDVSLPDKDLGRGAVKKSPRQKHAFRTPSLREIVDTAPYMHDGSLATLEAVVAHYSNKLVQGAGSVRPVYMSSAEQSDLVAFLRTLRTEPSMP